MKPKIFVPTFATIALAAICIVLWRKRHEWLAPIGAWFWGLSVSVLAVGGTWAVHFFDNHQGTMAVVIGFLGLAIQLWAVVRGNTDGKIRKERRHVVRD